MAQWMCFFEKKDMYRADSSGTRIAFFRGLFVFLQSLAVGLLLFSFWLPYDISYNFYSYVLGVSVGISVVYACLRPRQSWSWVQLKPYWPWVALYLLFLISVSYSIDKAEALKSCGRYLSLVLYPVVFVGMGTSFFTRKRLRSFAICYLLSCLIESICRVVVLVRVFLTVPQLDAYKQAGFFSALNEFIGFQNIYVSWSEWDLVMNTTFEALFLNLAFALVALAWMKKDKLFTRLPVRIGASFALCWFALNLATSNSKTGQILFVLTFLLLIVFAFRHRRFWFGGISVSLVVLGGIVAMPYVGKGLTSRIQRSYQIVMHFAHGDLQKVESDGSTLPRIYCWETAWDLFREHPLLGIGVGRTSVFKQAYMERHGDSPMLYKHSHNQFLDLMLSNGVVGLIVFLWFWILALKMLWKSRDMLAGIWLLGLFIVCMTDVPLYVTCGLFYMCAFFGVFSVLAGLGSKPLSKD